MKPRHAGKIAARLRREAVRYAKRKLDRHDNCTRYAQLILAGKPTPKWRRCLGDLDEWCFGEGNDGRHTEAHTSGH